MPALGHIVLQVREPEGSRRFCEHLVGLSAVGELFGDRALVMTGGRSHHELMLMSDGQAPGRLRRRRLGLHHVGWKVGDADEALHASYDRACEHGCEIKGVSDHGVSESLYLTDPDGNEVESFVDNPAFDVRNDDGWLYDPVKPLRF